MVTSSSKSFCAVEKMPRIGLICLESMPNNQRVVVTNLGNLLGRQFRLFCVTGTHADLPANHSPIQMRSVEVPRFNPRSFGYVLHAGRKLWMEDLPDALICVSNPFPHGLGLLLFRRFYPTRIVLRITGDHFRERAIHRNPLVRLRKYLMHEMLMPRILRHADALLCVGVEIAEQLVHRGIPRDRVYVLPQPVDTNLFPRISPERRSAIRTELGIKSGECMALTVSSHNYGKGLDRLPYLVELTRNAIKPVQFVTVGDGPLRSKLDEMRLPRLHVLGPRSREATLELFAAADLLVHPTRRDGLPNVILEAIGFGLPIVSTPVGEIPRYVSNIANSEAGLAALVMKGDLEAERVPGWFDWESQKTRYEAVFKQILTAPART